MEFVSSDYLLLSEAAEEIGISFDELLKIVSDNPYYGIFFETDPDCYLWVCNGGITLPPEQGSWLITLFEDEIEEIIENGFIKQDSFGNCSYYISKNPKFKHAGIEIKKEQLLISEADFIIMTQPSSQEEIVKHRELEEKKIQDNIRVVDVTQTERNTMLKLIIGMAIDAYSYDPDATKNKATGENNGSIKVALDRLGINLDADTIRKYLNEAKVLLPPQTQQYRDK